VPAYEFCDLFLLIGLDFSIQVLLYMQSKWMFATQNSMRKCLFIVCIVCRPKKN
jgi:hypothetical protein